MSAKALSKVHKQLSKKRGKLDSLHENSRDAKRLRRASAREEKLSKAAATMMKTRQSYIDRVMYFQQTLHEDRGPLSDEDTVQLITKYISRHADELSQLRAECRKGRPPSKREETLAEFEKTESKEFATGFWVPDMGDEENMQRLRAWNGEWSAMSNVKFVRVTKDGEKKQSSFPPRGLS